MLSTFEYRVFWFFGALCVLTIGFVWLLVPETKGRSLEELEDLSH
jgi:SP family xylose:H+ symportor-like MFS transporter